MSGYVQKVSASIAERYQSKPEYVQAVQSWLESIEPAVEADPIYEKNDLLTRMVEPDRMLTFLVPWTDDAGNTHTCHGYRCQFSNAIGPYKGGIRFQPSVNGSVVKFLAFEQTYKNALTGLPLGGAAGGADFDPRGKSPREIMRFCQSYMTELFRYIGSATDIPAGDIGVGSREIGYLYGTYKKLSGLVDPSVMTGKDASYGGTQIRATANGTGAIYFLENMLKHDGETLSGKTISVSGFGNTSYAVCRAAAKAGARVVTLSGPDGYIYDPAGITTEEKLGYVLSMRMSGNDVVAPYAEKFGVDFYPGKKPWSVPVDVAMPCATQNELDVEDAVSLIANHVRYYVEAANMPATAAALKLLRQFPAITVAGSKAAGSGGVAVSALELAQDSVRYSWTDEETDAKLKEIMYNIYENSLAAAEEYGLGYDLIAGNNIAAFKKVAAAMLAQGL